MLITIEKVGLGLQTRCNDKFHLSTFQYKILRDSRMCSPFVICLNTFFIIIIYKCKGTFMPMTAY